MLLSHFQLVVANLGKGDPVVISVFKVSVKTQVRIIANIDITYLSIGGPDFQIGIWAFKPDMNDSLLMVQPTEAPGKYPYLLATGSEEMPSRRKEACRKYF